eukprot:gene10572-12299_t
MEDENIASYILEDNGKPFDYVVFISNSFESSFLAELLCCIDEGSLAALATKINLENITCLVDSSTILDDLKSTLKLNERFLNEFGDEELDDVEEIDECCKGGTCTSEKKEDCCDVNGVCSKIANVKIDDIPTIKTEDCCDSGVCTTKVEGVTVVDCCSTGVCVPVVDVPVIKSEDCCSKGSCDAKITITTTTTTTTSDKEEISYSAPPQQGLLAAHIASLGASQQSSLHGSIRSLSSSRREKAVCCPDQGEKTCCSLVGSLVKSVKLDASIPAATAGATPIEETPVEEDDEDEDDSPLARKGDKPISLLLFEQLTFASTIIFNKTDLVEQEDLEFLEKLVLLINQNARILKTVDSNVRITDLFGAKSATIRSYQPTTEDRDGIFISNFYQRIPFHPQRLFNFIYSSADGKELNQQTLSGVIYLNGFLWLATDMKSNYTFEINSTYKLFSTGTAFYSTIDEKEWPQDPRKFTEGIVKCLLTDAELEEGPNGWESFVNPFAALLIQDEEDDE